jgi:hypothetical protein
MVAYTVNNGAMVNFAGLLFYPELHGTIYKNRRWMESVPEQEFIDAFSGFEPMVRTLAEVG